MCPSPGPCKGIVFVIRPNSVVFLRVALGPAPLTLYCYALLYNEFGPSSRPGLLLLLGELALVPINRQDPFGEMMGHIWKHF